MPKKKERVKRCFTLNKSFVKKLDNISNKTGVPRSRLVESCFGDSDTLAGYKKFCASLKKPEKEEK